LDGREAKPAAVGDFVTTVEGLYGRVLKERWDHGTGIAAARSSGRQLLVVVEEEDEHAVERWVLAGECWAEHGPCGSYEVCQAVDSGARCGRWAVRSVTAIPLNDRGGELCDADGYALDGFVPERRAVCWQHLPAAVFWAGLRFGHGRTGVCLGDVAGGSRQQPDGFEAMSLSGLGQPACVQPGCDDSPAAAVAREVAS
jgi:hypothetical protein